MSEKKRSQGLFKPRESITPKDNPLIKQNDPSKKKRIKKDSEVATAKPTKSLTKQELIRQYIELKSQLRTVEQQLEKTRKHNQQLSNQLTNFRNQPNDRYFPDDYEEDNFNDYEKEYVEAED